MKKTIPINIETVPQLKKNKRITIKLEKLCKWTTIFKAKQLKKRL